jgi:hypothetical protein
MQKEKSSLVSNIGGKVILQLLQVLVLACKESTRMFNGR